MTRKMVKLTKVWFLSNHDAGVRAWQRKADDTSYEARKQWDHGARSAEVSMAACLEIP